MAAIGGDHFGLDNDKEMKLPKKVSTVIDLLEDKGISWSEYHEGMPYTGFTGSYVNQKTGRNNYVRRHNVCSL